ncbi:Far1 [Hordeum vulgare]|nr:Far1 [Hordeum vulgare]
MHHFLDLAYRYVGDMLGDAQVYADHAVKPQLDAADVRLAIQAKSRSTHKQSTTVLLRSFYMGVSPWNRLDVIENKVATIELIANLDKKIHNPITEYGSKVGMVLKNLKEKEPTVKEKLGHDSARIGKLEDVITNFGSAFAVVQNSTNFAHNKLTKSVFVPKNSGESSSKKHENLKMISDHATYGFSTKDDDT